MKLEDMIGFLHYTSSLPGFTIADAHAVLEIEAKLLAAQALAKAAGLAITEKENPLSLYNLDLRLTEFEQAGRDEATK